MSAATAPSPLTGASSPAVASVPVERILEYYRAHRCISVDRFFEDVRHVAIHRCPDTGYEFYWPRTTAGDAAFYAELAEQAWYYEEDRWEHHAAVDLLQGGERVLDVGAGAGAFLQLVGRAHPDCELRGLELSTPAVRAAQAAGVDVQEASVEDVAAAHPASVDVVTSFQVLEHLAEPLPHLRSLVRLARPGALVVIGVPNNDGHLRELRETVHYCLNVPPHHMGLWRRSSLASLTRILPLEIVDFQEEPLSRGALERLAYARMARTLGGGALAGLAWRLGLHHVYGRVARTHLMREPGHTVLAVFRRSTDDGSGG